MKSDLVRLRRGATGSKKILSDGQKCRCQQRIKITRLAGTEVNEKN